jgi:hypothetical protein
MGEKVGFLAEVHETTVTKVLTKLIGMGMEHLPPEVTAEANRKMQASQEAAAEAHLKAVRTRWWRS